MPSVGANIQLIG